jgi:hypothetical protein
MLTRHHNCQESCARSTVPIDILSIMGISTDNSTSVCEVYMILNEIKPYQQVNPTGNNNVTDNRDYST